VRKELLCSPKFMDSNLGSGNWKRFEIMFDNFVIGSFKFFNWVLDRN
jgi:hypothetical protein